MTIGEKLYLALALFGVFAFMVTLAWQTYGPGPRPRQIRQQAQSRPKANALTRRHEAHV